MCNHRAFGYIVLICILLSSISLGAEDPVDADSVRNKVRRSHWLTTLPLLSLSADSEHGRLFLHRGVHRRNLLEGKVQRESHCQCLRVFQIVAYGLILHADAFCRNRFNILDIVVVSVSLISMVIKDRAMSVVKILRVLRVLRPLRAINRAKGLKVSIPSAIELVQNITRSSSTSFNALLSQSRPSATSCWSPFYSNSCSPASAFNYSR